MHIIGIELLNDKKNIFKNLNHKNANFNGWYSFCSYDSCEKPPKIDSPISFYVSDNFYKFKNSNTNINISCIVGKNGSGKSTLLDVLYRLINNFAFCIKSIFPYNGCDLIYSLGFSAALYFSILQDDGKEYVGYIKNIDSKKLIVKLPNEKELEISIKNNKGVFEVDSGLSAENFSLSKLQDLFYTIVTNYSMYSFNPEDFESNDFYPEGIFHKNDAYITPIVLLPYRDSNGVILIDNERDLARQRIIALQIFLYNYKNGNHKIIKNKIPLKVSYRFDKTYIENHDKKEINALFKELQNKINNFLDTDLKTREVYGKNLICNQLKYNEYFKYLKNSWAKRILQKNEKKDVSEFEIDEEMAEGLLHYLAFKTLKTCAHYGLFIKYINFRKNEQFADEVVDEILKDNTFITLKLRQCFNFFSLDYRYENGLYETNYKKIAEISCGEEKCIDDYFLQLPPSIFETDLIFEDEFTKKEINLSSFSSGELQLLNSFSYVLYHLKNLECDKTELTNKNNIDYPNYKNFFLIFDEAELYMHPEYQRLFLYRLIELINNCNFNAQTQIQILIATHSPYILSDVPLQNVLLLDNGEIQTKNLFEDQTFAANIYDLLQKQFFMTAPIGEIAKNRINEIISFCKNEISFDNVEEKIQIYDSIINNLGDSYFKNTLFYMLNKKKKELTNV